MTTQTVETLVIGGGQAGLAMSAQLRERGLEHLVLERHRIAERWRSERWDSLVANGPAWHDRFPVKMFADTDPNGFAGKEAVAGYFEAFAREIDAPIRCDCAATRLRRIDGRPRFHVETSKGPIEALRVVVATGPFQRPLIPPLVPDDAGLVQLHSSAYRNPEQLPPGGVLVVGSGASGVQIADELNRAGKPVYLSVGPHHRPPRRYRGLDYCWWLGVLGKWDAVAAEPGMEHVTIAVSGAHGGQTVDFRGLAADGITLVGMTRAFEDGVVRFAPDLAETIARGDANYRSVLDEADAFAARHGLELPDDPEARAILPDPACLKEPLLALDLRAAGITAILWATGYALDFGWIEIDLFDERGRPRHERGVSSEPGLYFLGLPWLSRRGSSFIWGVWHDAAYLADQIAIQRHYMAHHTAIMAHSASAAHAGLSGPRDGADARG